MHEAVWTLAAFPIGHATLGQQEKPDAATRGSTTPPYMHTLLITKDAFCLLEKENVCGVASTISTSLHIKLHTLAIQPEVRTDEKI
jgi:hypothetical protein